MAWAKVLSTKAVSQRLPDVVALAEGRRSCRRSPVGKLALVAGDHQLLGLGHDLRLELAALLEVRVTNTSGAKRIMFCSPQPKGIWQELLQPVDGLGQVAGGQRR